MDIKNLNEFPEGETFETDLLIIGGGAAGLTIAREFFGTSTKVMIAESGDTEQTDEHEQLNEVVLDSKSIPETWLNRRRDYHGHQAEKWNADVQRFGVRCRGLGGSTAAWAGKSAPFAEHDFIERDWLPISGWPMSRDALEPYFRRAEERMNLGLGSYGDDFWERYNGKAKRPDFDNEVLSSFLWQFARSRTNPVSMMRMGPDFMAEKGETSNIRVLVNATAKCVTPVEEATGTYVEVDLIGLGGGAGKVRAKKVVISCGALENARLLLASKTKNPNGLGNDRDQVGRYLMDHMSAPLASFDKEHVKAMSYLFGFFGIKSDNRVDMYMHGFELNLPTQQIEELLSVGAYCVPERAGDDPWGALVAILRGKSESIPRDMFRVIKGTRMMISGAGRIFLQSEKVPAFIRNGIVNTMVRLFPNSVVEEYQSGGLPRKLIGCNFEGIVEQEPLAHNRVLLSDQKNALGEPLPLVEWEPGERPIRTLRQLGVHMEKQFQHAGLPAPTVQDWVRDNNLPVPLIDMAHTSGTTRMSTDETTGVVDENCQVRHTQGVYMAGGSVLPTCGHANPTLMIVSLAIRLADHLKQDLN